MVEIVQVVLCGAGIGIAVHLFASTWDMVRAISTWTGVHPAAVLSIGGIGGALTISAEFWLLVALLQA